MMAEHCTRIQHPPNVFLTESMNKDKVYKTAGVVIVLKTLGGGRRTMIARNLKKQMNFMGS